jgi:peroxiredoxin
MKKMMSLLMSMFLISPLAFAGVKTGADAPMFNLRGANGQDYNLAQYKGKIVVLEWLNHGCPFVKKHYDAKLKNMQNMQAKYTKNSDVVWFSIISSAEGKQGFSTADGALKDAKTHGAAPTAILLDTTGKVGKLYDAKTTPHMFVIDKAGKVVYQGAIDDKASSDASDIPTSKNYVALALDQLLDKDLAAKPLKFATTQPYGCSVKY